MLTPNQLYYYYTTNPCEEGFLDFLSRPTNGIGAGTPYDLPRLTNFLKQLKYPCYSKAKYTTQLFIPNEPEQLIKDGTLHKDLPEDKKGILNSGKYRVAFPYKILSKIDIEAFSEIQPDVKSGTSMAIRNACDIARACLIEREQNKPYEQWEHRMAYEYLYALGSNNLTECLMMLGPDLVSESEALDRGSGCDDLDCLPKFSSKVPGSALGAEFSCAKDLNTSQVTCTPCRACENEGSVDPIGQGTYSRTGTITTITINDHGLNNDDYIYLDFLTGEAIDGYYKITVVDSNIFTVSRNTYGTDTVGNVRILEGPELTNCCSAGTCAEKMRWCCGDVTGERDGVWRYTNLAAGSINFGYPIITGDEFPLKHGGILKRKSYDGYINLKNSTGSKLYSCPIDLLLSYIQKLNNYDYENNITFNPPKETIDPIDRIRTISMIYSSSSSEMTGWIKDLIYNGYGVVLMTNVGFPNKRDSTGLSYPDRIWYHTYTIIGYDDRKVDYPECVFLLSNSWGKWNSGGHPSWGPIPDGSFLVTESHLQCMLDLYRTDQKGCRKKGFRPGEYIGATSPTTSTTETSLEDEACVQDSSCTPWDCATHQQAMGMAFALSFHDGFPRQILDYDYYYRTSHNISITDLEFTFRPPNV